MDNEEQAVVPIEHLIILLGQAVYQLNNSVIALKQSVDNLTNVLED